MLQKRNIALSVVFSIITCGIYTFYWIYMMNEESKYFAKRENETSGGLVILLGIVTCGIYLYYWYYQMGKRMQAAQEAAGLPSEDRSIIYLIVAIVGFSIVNDCLIQDDLNKLIDSTGGSVNEF